MRVLLMIALLLPATLSALEYQGMDVPDTAQVGDQALQLNGVGMRTKFIFDVYAGALYLPHSVSQAKDVLDADGNKRVELRIVLDELSKEKMVNAFVEAIENNVSDEKFLSMKTTIDAFSASLNASKAGDIISMDFIGDSVLLMHNGKQTGVVDDAVFSQELLKVWFGDDPVDADLTQGMLGL